MDNNSGSGESPAKLFITDPKYRVQVQAGLDARARQERTRDLLQRVTGRPTVLPESAQREAPEGSAGGGVTVANPTEGTARSVSMPPVEVGGMADRVLRNPVPAGTSVDGFDARYQQLQDEARAKIDTGVLRVKERQGERVAFPSSRLSPAPETRSAVEPSVAPILERRLPTPVPTQPAPDRDAVEWVGQPSQLEVEKSVPISVWGIQSNRNETGFVRSQITREGSGVLNITLPKDPFPGMILVADIPGMPGRQARFEVNFTSSQPPARIRGEPLNPAEIMVTPMSDTAYAERTRIDRGRHTMTLGREVHITLPEGMNWESFADDVQKTFSPRNEVATPA